MVAAGLSKVEKRSGLEFLAISRLKTGKKHPKKAGFATQAAFNGHIDIFATCHSTPLSSPLPAAPSPHHYMGTQL